MEEMIDRVAKALFQKTGPKLDWDNSTDFMKRETREFARAAIEAMREPTEAMLTAGAKAAADSVRSPRGVYVAMVGAALSPSTRGE